MGCRREHQNVTQWANSQCSGWVGEHCAAKMTLEAEAQMMGVGQPDAMDLHLTCFQAQFKFRSPLSHSILQLLISPSTEHPCTCKFAYRQLLMFLLCS